MNAAFGFRPPFALPVLEDLLRVLPALEVLAMRSPYLNEVDLSSPPLQHVSLLWRCGHVICPDERPPALGYLVVNMYHASINFGIK